MVFTGGKQNTTVANFQISSALYLVPERDISFAKPLEIPQSCTKPSALRGWCNNGSKYRISFCARLISPLLAHWSIELSHRYRRVCVTAGSFNSIVKKPKKKQKKPKQHVGRLWCQANLLQDMKISAAHRGLIYSLTDWQNQFWIWGTHS